LIKTISIHYSFIILFADIKIICGNFWQNFSD
jgi:hypothetical protein